MADLNEQDLLDYDEEEQEVKDIKAKKDVKVNILPFGGTRDQLLFLGFIRFHSFIWFPRFSPQSRTSQGHC